MKPKTLCWKQSQFAWIASRDQTDQPPSDVPLSVRQFAGHLLEFGGSYVCIRFTEEHSCETFRSRGELMDSSRIKFRLGTPRECHENSYTLYKSEPEKYKVAEGYGCSSGMWRHHIWVMEGGEVVETTVKRDLYFGIIQASRSLFA